MRVEVPDRAPKKESGNRPGTRSGTACHLSVLRDPHLGDEVRALAQRIAGGESALARSRDGDRRSASESATGPPDPHRTYESCIAQSRYRTPSETLTGWSGLLAVS